LGFRVLGVKAPQKPWALLDNTKNLTDTCTPNEMKEFPQKKNMEK
jgi:hypothetical protein